MRAMLLTKLKAALQPVDLPKPVPGSGEVLVEIGACGVCRTDLHVIDGDLPNPALPLIIGHQIVGRVVGAGSNAERFRIGDRVGIPWLAWTCGACEYCKSGRENLCDNAQFTGYTRAGGYAEFTVADERFCVGIPEAYGDAEAAPLLCAGLIGYRSLMKTGNANRLGIFGFGAAAVLVIQAAVFQGRQVHVYTRANRNQELAKTLGAAWVGDSDHVPADTLDAAIIFAPAGELVPVALRAVRKGGIVVCGGIHMTDIPQFPYEWLWGERTVSSVANLTRKDAEDFMAIAPRVPVRTFVETFLLGDANEALNRFRNGQVRGSAVLIV